MKKNVLVYGCLSGSIFVIFMFLLGRYHNSFDMERGMIYGYTTMILAFSFVFAGVKNYRDKYTGGTLSFGKAFQLGLLISLLSSCFYVASWLVVNKTMLPNFADEYADAYVKKTAASGASPAVIAKTTKEMEEFKTMYKNPVYVVLMTFLEVLPVGILISLIAAFALKRKPKPSQSA
ncbi:MAG: DUF4199 domain-containing protein [Chitinophagaceae bacterium]|nr:DUF4199 domain-containing protein [Chitinophagaceae bacterium]